MYCKKCGKELQDNWRVCPDCGTKIGLNSQGIKECEKEKSESKFKKIMGLVGSGVILVILIMALTGVFDNVAYDITDGAFGKGDNYESKIELSSYLEYSEEEIINSLNVSANDFGCYPDDEVIHIMCMDGKVYMIQNYINNPDCEDYTLFGILIGDSGGKVAEQLKGSFEKVESMETDEGVREFYVDIETGYLLMIDYDFQKKVMNISYVCEDSGYLTEEAQTTSFLGEMGVYASCDDSVDYPGRLDLTVDDNDTIYVAVGSMDYFYDAGYWGTYEAQIIDENTLYVEMDADMGVSFTLSWSPEDPMYLTVSSDTVSKWTGMDAGPLSDVLQGDYAYAAEFN